VNVGRPRTVDWRGRRVRSAIWKAPVEGPVRVTRLSLEGDTQSDLRVHGGPDKAVYAYPSEHYAYWARELSDAELPWGAFGENLTTLGLLERDVRVGDTFLVGTAVLQVTDPRMPCYKLGVRFGRDDMVKRFLEHGGSGFYLAVVREGEVSAGDRIELTARSDQEVTIADVVDRLRERSRDRG
jgi:MOSC domain-containing protein YiiM